MESVFLLMKLLVCLLHYRGIKVKCCSDVVKFFIFELLSPSASDPHLIVQ